MGKKLFIRQPRLSSSWLGDADNNSSLKQSIKTVYIVILASSSVKPVKRKSLP